MATLVQTVVGGVSGVLTSTTLTINNTTPGNKIIAYVLATAAPTSVLTVHDNKNAGNYAADSVNGASAHNGLCIASMGNIVGGTTIVTASTTTSQTWRLVLEEWANVGAGDQKAANQSASNGTAISSGASGVLAQANELVVCFAYVSNVATFTQGAGFTLDPNLGAGTRGIEYQIVNSTAAQTGTFTINTSLQWDCLLATYQLPTGGGGGSGNGMQMLLGVGS